MRRPWKKALWLSLIVLSMAVGTFSCIYWYTWTKDPDVEVIELKIRPAKIHIGEVIHIEIVTDLPWYRRPGGQIRLDVPDGLQIVDTTERKWTGLSWGKWTWKSILKLQAYDFGPFRGLEARVSVTLDKSKQHGTLAASLPDIVIVSRLGEEETDLQMAPELSEEFLRQRKPNLRTWSLICSALILLVVAFYLLFLRRPQKKEDGPKPWTVAQSLLCGLEARLPLEAETVFVELTDIIRRYIESAYNLPATERTTPEFLKEIKRSGTELSTDSGLLLMDFLTAADMVKFARLDATQNQIQDAIKKAERFITETSEPIIKSQKER